MLSLVDSSKRPGKEVEMTKHEMQSANSSMRNGVESPKLLRVGEGTYIFRIPENLVKIHPQGFEPERVSIGPYHHGKTHLKMIEEHKPRYLQLFLNEATKGGVDKTFLERKILDMETDIRNSYSEKLVDFDKDKLIDMMLLDGCFILMLILFKTRRIDSALTSPEDPILKTPCILPNILRDLLLMENQVPFILLEKLFEQTKFGSGSLNELVLKFYDYDLVGDKDFMETRNIGDAKHLLDLVRKFFIPITSPNDGPQDTRPKLAYVRVSAPDRVHKHYLLDRVDRVRKLFISNDGPQNLPSFLGLIPSTKRLLLQGIKFNTSSIDGSSKWFGRRIIDCFFTESHAFIPKIPSEGKILEIELKGNEIQIPPIVLDEFMSLVLLNCVALEQLSMNCSNDVTSYVVFMGCLMNDGEDALYLNEKGIIDNYFGNGNDVSQFFKNISKGIVFDISKSYLKDVFEGINKYTSKRRNVEFARFMRLYFDSPWSLMSSIAILAILLLTIFQATFAALAYFHPPKQRD